MGSVVVLITLLVGLLSGLTAGLARENISAVTGLDADHLAFAAPPTGRRSRSPTRPSGRTPGGAGPDGPGSRPPSRSASGP